MLDFKQFVEDIIDKRGINENDSLELKDEILSHLSLLKDEYLEKSYNEEEAIKLSIKNFGNSNLIGNNLKSNLPSKNKYYKFNFKNMIKLICNMILLYLILVFFFACIISKNINSKYFSIVIPFILTIFSFLYINIKINNTKSAIKSIIICNISSFIIIKLLSTFILFIAVVLFGSPFNRSLLWSLFSYLIIHIFISFMPFVTFTISSIIFTKLSNKIIFSKIRNIYETKLTSVLFFFLSIVLLISFYMLPNSNLILKGILMNLTNSKIIQFHKNILYLVVNENILIPNIGLIFLLFLLIKLFMLIYKKGIKSIF
ncbi:hypothetical protein D4Z93_08070 [Clostridium fermenticellae]|uniref:Uncharacterized protein n=1 Tax=Clostridium fermenticellae TaxID=2068654 RepID=A0A386H4M6_9CLOT|nr:permease prefix domain 1-containing protein [Clostridium fermenticellae]AYD40483.1 hypothetical protein D4Z93_08070 [Clostridium fermenticellae]